jgi:hypothetical protein
MENLLLICDEIDDAIATLRMLWPQLLGFVMACCLFGLSIVVAMHWPAVTAILAGLLLAMLLPKPYLKSVRFRTDP